MSSPLIKRVTSAHSGLPCFPLKRYQDRGMFYRLAKNPDKPDDLEIASLDLATFRSNQTSDCTRILAVRRTLFLPPAFSRFAWTFETSIWELCPCSLVLDIQYHTSDAVKLSASVDSYQKVALYTVAQGFITPPFVPRNDHIQSHQIPWRHPYGHQALLKYTD